MFLDKGIFVYSFYTKLQNTAIFQSWELILYLNDNKSSPYFNSLVQ